MKWGVRRAQKRAERNERADRRIRRLETNRKKNKLEYEEMKAVSRDAYSAPNKSKKLKKSLANDKAVYDISETTNKYLIAKNKAKKDETYKQSAEYQKAKRDYGKQTSQQILYGNMGHQRIETLKNMGMSEKKAKGKVAAEQVLAGVAAGFLMLGTSYAINKLT